MFHASRRSADGSLQGHLDGGVPAVLPAPEMLATDPCPAQLHVSIVMTQPSTIVSRRVPALVKELFHERYPAVARGEVDVYAVAREPGVRCKVALDSDSADPEFIARFVGDGAALKQIVRDCGDPIIDLVATDPNPAYYACGALGPTQVEHVAVDEDARMLTLTIADSEPLDAVHFQLASDLVHWALRIRRAGLVVGTYHPR